MIPCLSARGWAAVLLTAALTFSAAASPSAAQQQTVLTSDQARQFGFALVERGDPRAAIAIARALIQQNPDDSGAWILLARALRTTGDFAGAKVAASRANRVARDDDTKFGASMELSAANFGLGRPMASQFWLRRAAQVAPTPELKATAVRNFRQVAARNPWQIALQFSLVPSSNVNNGSRSTVIEIGGLPFILSGDAQALPGVEAAFGGTARYRFRGLGDRPAQLTFGAAVQRVRLSDDAKAQAPDAKGSDYAFDALEFGYGQILSDPQASAVWRLDTLVGRNWYGGDALSNYARAAVAYQWQSGEASVSSASIAVERQVRLDQDIRSAWVTRVDYQQAWRLGSGDTLSANAGLRKTQSQSSEIDHEAAVAGIGYKFGKPLFAGMTLEGGLSFEHRDYDRSPYSVDGRRDNRIRLTATVGFPQFDYFGFAPTLTFEGQRNDSNVSLYKSEDYGVRIGVQSVF